MKPAANAALMAILLTGCLTPAAPPEADAPEAALPSSLGVDLRQYVEPPNKALHPTAFGGG